MGNQQPTKQMNPKKIKKSKQWRKERRQRLGLEQTGGAVNEQSVAGRKLQGRNRQSLVVTGRLNGVAVSGLIDTGSATSLISHQLYQRLPENDEMVMERVYERYSGVSGNALAVYGRIEGELTLGHALMTQSLIVAEIDTEMILGMDFLSANQCRLDLSRGILHLGSEEIQCWDENEDNAHFRVTCRDKVELPPHTATTVIGRIARTGNITKWGVVESSQEVMNKNGIIVGRSVVSTKQDAVPVRVRNCGNTVSTVYPDQLLGWCESIQWCGDDLLSREDVTRQVNCTRTSKGAKRSAAEGAAAVKVPSHLEDLFERSSRLLNDQERQKLAAVLTTYADVFSKDKTDLGKTDLVKHQIHTGDARPIKQHPRRLPFAKRHIEKEEVEKMLKQGIIEPSVSPWASCVVLVKKKDGSMRFCIDYRKLNEVTMKDAFPLPRMDDCLDSMAGAHWFSTMDLSSGFWQVEMDPESKEKTAFTTRSGLYQFKVMPFGLVNAPSTFERLMEEVMRGMQWEECLIYLDDIISFGVSFDQELERLTRVFDRLRQAGLKLKPSKCHLFQDQVEFLGHLVSKEGVSTCPEKIAAVQDWPVPTTVKEVRSFLGLCSYYRRFVQGFAQIARPLNALVKKDQKFQWTAQCHEAFNTLKQSLVSAPVLAYPTQTGQFILDTDASKEAVGAVLSQVQDGQEKVIAYYSKALNVHERHYCVTRLEMLAVVSAVRKFKSYLWGHPVKLRTDNAAVSYMMSMKEPQGQLARWIEELSCYDLLVTHRAGRSHMNADAMSRRPCRQCGREEPLEIVADATEVQQSTDMLWQADEPDGEEPPQEELEESAQEESPHCAVVTRGQKQGSQEKQPHIWLEGWDQVEVRDSQLRDMEIGFIMNAVDGDAKKPDWSDVCDKSQAVKTLWGQWKRLAIINGVLYRKWELDDGSVTWQMIVPQEKRNEVMHHCHDVAAAGHLGVARTIARVKQGFFWAGLKQDVRQYVRRCDECTARKLPNGAPKVPMKDHIAGSPMSRIAVDVLGPLTRTADGHVYILVIGDYFTKYCAAFPLPNQETNTIVKALVEGWICHWGVPERLHSDQGRNFESQLFKETMEYLGIKKTRTTALHPQSNGMVERFNKTLVNMLAIYVKDCPNRWDEYVKFACMAYNSSVHSTTGFSPFRMRFGEEMRLPIHVLTGNPNSEEQADGVSDPEEAETYLDKLKSRMKKIHEVARKVTKKKVKLYKDQYDTGLRSRQLKVGQAVWLYRPQRKKGVCPKLQNKWEKGYVVTHQLDDVLYRVQKGRNGRSQVVHIQRLMPYLGRNPPKWWKGGGQSCLVSGRGWTEAVQLHSGNGSCD